MSQPASNAQRKTNPFFSSWNIQAMAAVAGEESETQLCSNCQKDIPLANFTIHEIHCSRNIGVCPLCKESFPKAEMQAHQDQEHAQIVCKCSMKMDRGALLDHVASQCPLRPAACRHCEIELTFSKLQDHEDYCGARTERCGRCNRNVMLRALKEHPKECGKKTEPEPSGQAKPWGSPEAAFHNVQPIRNVLQPNPCGEAPSRSSSFSESRAYGCVSDEQLPRESSRRNNAPLQLDPNANQDPPKTTVTSRLLDEESHCHLDYLLALSLQQESRPSEPSEAEFQRELWRNVWPTQARPAGDARNDAPGVPVAANVLNRPQTETLLPCEFCEELFPEDDLILHQTGCNPASALASFSKRSNFLPPAECLSGLWGWLQHSRGETSPPGPDPQESLMLPCEFCGVQLEEEILFHHQDQCDLRPATAPSRGPTLSGAPAMESAESPELLRRRVWLQGESSPQQPEPFRQKPPLQHTQRAPAQGNVVVAQRVQRASPVNGREVPIGPSKGRKPMDLGDGEGRTPSQGPGDPAGAVLRSRNSPLELPSSSYVPSFPVKLPTRPSRRPEGGRSPARSSHFDNSKAKPWQTGSATPDDE